jgi:O-antigen ligase
MTFASFVSGPQVSVDHLPYLAPGLFLFILPFPGTVALRLISLGIAAITAALMWRRVAPPRIPLKLPIALWMAVSVLSLVWALDPQYSLGEIKNEIGYTLVAFLTFYALTHSERQWRLWKWSFLIGACLVTSFAAYYFLRGMPDRLFGGQGQVGWHGGPGNSSTYYILLCPFLFIALEQSLTKSTFRSVPWLLLIMMAIGGYLSYNRAFWIALAISAISFMGLRLFRRTSHDKALKLTAIFSVAALGLSAAFLLTVIRSRFSTEMSPDGLLEFLTRDPRIALWEFSLRQIWAHPFAGTGFGVGSAKSVLDGQHFADPQLWHAHNIFLNYGLQMGIPGMIALLVILVAIAREFISLYRSPDDSCSMLGAAGLAIVIGITVKSMTDVHLGAAIPCCSGLWSE